MGMGWLSTVTISELVFFTLVRAFYSKATYGMGGPITSIVRGVKIHLDPESICRIFDITSIGLKVYESKMWPILPSFEPKEAIQRICGLLNAHRIGKPSTSVECYIICCVLFFYHGVDTEMRSPITRHSL